ATGKADNRNEQFENIEALKISYQDAANARFSELRQSSGRNFATLCQKNIG
ncbi:MAG: hypothetical protein HC851_23015, partial [Acaryochloris sp. RU_4_1]|nr:hypothetical protein [Acaryochloris sp. RU_4_1]